MVVTGKAKDKGMMRNLIDFFKKLITTKEVES